MPTPLDSACCASLPVDTLADLAPLRCLPGVRLQLGSDRAWLYWEPGTEEVLRCLLPLAGVQLYLRRGDFWYLPGHHLPAFEVPPESNARSLEGIITPMPVQPQPVPALDLHPETLRLVPDDRPRPATALWCNLTELLSWAETATTAQLEAVQAAHSGQRILLLGGPLPPLSRVQRLWGERLLVPLGCRTEPALPESAILEALGIGDGEILVLGPEGAEAVPCGVFRPLTRAGVRLALREMV